MSTKKFMESVRLISIIAFVVIEAVLIVEIIKAVTQQTMFRFIAKIWAKVQYILKQEIEAETNFLHAGLATRLATEKRALVDRLTKEADAMDARIREVSDLEENGYFLCENGHEFAKCKEGSLDCPEPGCSAHYKFIKRAVMSGQEKYESDKERKEAKDIAKQKRDQAKAEEEAAANSEKTAKYFRDLAQNNRTIAEKIRRL